MPRCAGDVLYISPKPSLPVMYLTFYFIVSRRGNLRKSFLFNKSNTRDSVSLRYPKTEERVENTLFSDVKSENCVTACLKLSGYYL